MSYRSAPVFFLLVLFAGAAAADTVVESFENGFGPWRGAIANPPVAWRITPSTAQPFDGTWSMYVQVDGTNDDGQVFLLRELELPAGSWTIDLTFDLYSHSSGAIGAWNSIGFIGPYQPTVEADFTQSAYGERISAITQQGWNTFSIQRTLSGPATAYVAFGVDAVFEVQKTFYLDHAVLDGIPTQCGNGNCFAGEDPCNCAADCGAAPGGESTCDDGVDQDCDLLIDCSDPDCGGEPQCAGVVCDGDLSCEPGEESCFCYLDCGAAPLRETSCDDGIDNDCDGGVDCDDGQDCVTPECFGGGDCDLDGVCETGEDCTNCPTDCPYGPGASCGNGVCEIGNGEDCLSCPDDCNGKQGGKPADRYCCGDGAGENPVGCADPRCTGGGAACDENPVQPSCCGDLVCEGNESGATCSIDCGAPPSCGDGNCDPGEDSCACPADCGAPPAAESVCDDGADEDCDGTTDCADPDCAAAPPCSGSCAQLGESCSADADCCQNKCRGGKCR